MRKGLNAITWGVCGALMVAFALPVHAQNFGDRLRRTVERAAESEVQRRVDQETRRVTRCAMGDQRCIDQARRDGNDVEIVDSRGNPVPGGGNGNGDAGGDHPLITPYAGSVLRERHADAFNEYARIIGHDVPARTVLTERLEGRLTRLRYDNPGGRSTLEISRNYRSALEAQGFRVDYECSGRDECGSIRNPGFSRINGMNVGIARDVRYFTGKLRWNDVDAYVSIANNPDVTYVHVLESTAMDTGMVGVDAAAMAAGLDRDGRIELEGIFFDTGRATLTAESTPALEQVAALMRNQPALQLRVVGHTDSVGDFQDNVKLSQDRAEAVRLALLGRYGIDAGRLTAQGVGPSVPVASNDTEEGRSRNRRVELVKP